MPLSDSRDVKQTDIFNTALTPTLLGVCYSRLHALAEGLRHACNQEGVSGLHIWMHSYGTRLDHYASILQDEGARPNKSMARSAATLFLEKTCSKPTLLLRAVIRVQEKLLAVYEQLILRPDLDEELHDQLVTQEQDLRTVSEEMRDLQLSYEEQDAIAKG